MSYPKGSRTVEVPCTGCTQPFSRLISSLTKDNFCSVACYRAWAGRTSIEHFWARVEKTETCWLWMGPRRKGKWAYGAIKMHVQGQQIHSAHKMSWVLTYGLVLAGQDVLHRCDTPPCVRPEHLFLGTDTDNQQDAIKKGHFHFLSYKGGEDSPYHKLTWPVVDEARARYHAGETQRSIAQTLNVHPSTLSYVVHAKTWKESSRG